MTHAELQKARTDLKRFYKTMETAQPLFDLFPEATEHFSKRLDNLTELHLKLMAALIAEVVATPEDELMLKAMKLFKEQTRSQA